MFESIVFGSDSCIKPLLSCQIISKQEDKIDGVDVAHYCRLRRAVKVTNVFALVKNKCV